LHNTCLSKWQKEHEKLVVIYKRNIQEEYKNELNPYKYEIGLDDPPHVLGEMNSACFYPWDLHIMAKLD